MIPWENCPDVERIPGKVSGAWLIKGTRIPADAVVENAADATPEEVVAKIYPSLRLDVVWRIVAFANDAALAPRPA